MISHEETYKMTLEAPIHKWDEAVPLGNGETGVLLWGAGNRLKLSLDRSDLWDERTGGICDHPLFNYASLIDAVQRRDAVKLQIIDDLTDNIIATKLPVARLELTLDSETEAASFELDMRCAVGKVKDRNGNLLMECFCAADKSAIYFRTKPPLIKLEIVKPEYGGAPQMVEESGTVKNVASLQYKPGQSVTSPTFSYYIQPCADDMHYGIFCRTEVAGEWKIFIHKTFSMESMLAFRHTLETAESLPDFDQALIQHKSWWTKFWASSQLQLPDRRLEQHYNFCRYLYGSSSRAGSPPMALQGVWTADNGTLPPWRGDYHYDLNVQFCYCAYLNSGDLEAGECLLDFLSNQMPIFRKFAQRFFSCDGLAVPGVSSLAGQALGGWPQYSFSPTAGAWLAAMFTDHYRYTCDHDFLNNKAWPLVSGVGKFILALLEEQEDGKLRLPLSSSPEIHNGTLEAFLTPNSNYDLALIRHLFSDLVELAQAMTDEAQAVFWREKSAMLPELSINEQTGLMVSPDEILNESHRHHSHLMAIYPLCLLNLKEHREIIEHSLLQIDKLGTGEWVGYSFGWMAAINARTGRGDRCLRLLNSYLDGFVSRNGFHLNGDFKDLGFSKFKYRPFTLEGNFIAMQAVHEMLLQSEHGVITLFPALPSSWNEAKFDSLRAAGGFEVSAALEKGKLCYLKICAKRDGRVTIINPGRSQELLQCNCEDFDRSMQVWNTALKAGTSLILKKRQ